MVERAKLRDEAIAQFAKVKVIPNKDLKNAKLLDSSSGLSSVYKANFNDIKVCVKLPQHKRITRDELHEYKCIASIKPHPNVLALVGVSCDFMLHTSHVCLVTPFMDAGSIDKLYRMIGQKLGKPGSRPRPDSKNRGSEIKAKVADILYAKGLAGVALDMAKGIAHLHSEGTLHRDIAARNFLANKEGKVVVSDFGLSRKLAENSDTGSEEEVYHMSKPHDRLPVRWMAPETLPKKGKSDDQKKDLGQYDKKSDVWSFGVTLWELAHYCLILPYKSVENSIVMKEVTAGTLSLTWDKACDASDGYQKIVGSCMERSPEKRPSMEGIVTLLEELVKVDKEKEKEKEKEKAKEKEKEKEEKEKEKEPEIGRAVQQECRDRSRMPSSA
eukprot:TRINITY_DN32599_c0_g1_i7.p1 TRINITY_DN32599_c0_g1~~TRINITY_DN32599_c0_g1_i7.p1  ORF type:complete len:385 (-),score=60.73 TRINITY_DN32599_c0_g1_i7:10-1164(-)